MLNIFILNLLHSMVGLCYSQFIKLSFYLNLLYPVLLPVFMLFVTYFYLVYCRLFCSSKACMNECECAYVDCECGCVRVFIIIHVQVGVRVCMLDGVYMTKVWVLLFNIVVLLYYCILCFISVYLFEPVEQSNDIFPWTF